MSLADLPYNNSADTLPKKDSRLQSQQPQQKVSRSGLVYGTSFSRGSCTDGIRRFASEFDDMWYDSERFQLVSIF